MRFVLKNTVYLLFEIMEKNLEKYINVLIEKEKEIKSKWLFCKEHKFSEEERILMLKLNILTEIRAEAENLRDCDLKEEYRPKLYF